MAKKFSLEAVLSLTDKMTTQIGGIQKKMGVFSKGLSKTFKQNTFAEDFNKMGKASGRMLVGVGVAAGAASVAMGALITTTAASADEFIKQARVIGITSEELQALTYAADLQGVSTETLNTSLEKMMKNVGEARTGQGALAKYLAGTDRALLGQVRAAKSTEEVFTLLMGKLANTKDEFARAQFAQLAFGRSGMDMIKMANGGAEAISGLLNEAHRYGLVTNAASESSEVFLDETARLKAMLLGIKNQAFNALMPKVAELATELRKLFENTDNGTSIIARFKSCVEGIDIKKVIQDVINFGKWIVNAAVAVGKLLTTLAPLVPYILGIAVALKAASVVMGIFNAVAMANPISLIVVAIMAAVAAIALLIANWDSANKVIIVIKKSIMSLLALAFMPLIIAINVIISGLSAIGKLFGMDTSKMDAFKEGMNDFIKKNTFISGTMSTGEYEAAKVATYASPATRGSESRTYAESRTVNEVFVRPDKGAAISPTRGGAPAPTLNYGIAQ